jgi:hypothetical protein
MNPPASAGGDVDKDGFHHLVQKGDASALHDEAVNAFGMDSWSIGGGVATSSTRMRHPGPSPPAPRAICSR